jgi:hypothetical protein
VDLTVKIWRYDLYCERRRDCGGVVFDPVVLALAENVLARLNKIAIFLVSGRLAVERAVGQEHLSIRESHCDGWAVFHLLDRNPFFLGGVLILHSSQFFYQEAPAEDRVRQEEVAESPGLIWQE